MSRIIRHSGKYGICEQRLWETNSMCASGGLSRGLSLEGVLRFFAGVGEFGSGLKKAGLLVVGVSGLDTWVIRC